MYLELQLYSQINGEAIRVCKQGHDMITFTSVKCEFWELIPTSGKEFFIHSNKK